MKRDFSHLLTQIEEQYQFEDKDGSGLTSLLEGLADPHTKGVIYWDYIEVDTLLSLQKTRTTYPDEVIFIVYHQIHELYFKLIIRELEKITRPNEPNLNFDDWKRSLERSTRYIYKLIGSFDIMRFGLDGEEFQKFRKALLPASGFQTHQFRLIEIMLTSFDNLIKDDAVDENGKLLKNPLEKMVLNESNFNHIYWRKGVINVDSGKEAKILINFNEKYDRLFFDELKFYSESNVYSSYLNSPDDFKISVAPYMADLEESILMWKIAHLNTVRTQITGIRGTGGTEWRKYLPLKNQKISYFPIFWAGKDIDVEIRRMKKELPEKMIGEIRQLLR